MAVLLVSSVDFIPCGGDALNMRFKKAQAQDTLDPDSPF